MSGAVFQAGGQAGRAPFVVGPVDLVLYPGERVLVVGANGSGKSTLLRGLTGLYPPHCGTIRRDGRPVTDAERPAYRGLFSSVFTDREQPLGLAALSEQEAVALTHFAPASCRRFQTDRPGASTPEHALSRSERTRRAVARALLSQRPITVFDDILAGQDSDFRRCFYAEILAALSRAGRTAVLVSHDEGFDQTADRVLEVCRGVVVERTRAPSPEAPTP